MSSCTLCGNVMKYGWAMHYCFPDKRDYPLCGDHLVAVKDCGCLS
jgi:hypothetical protein